METKRKAGCNGLQCKICHFSLLSLVIISLTVGGFINDSAFTCWSQWRFHSWCSDPPPLFSINLNRLISFFEESNIGKMGSTSSCCVSSSPKLRRNAHSRLESHNPEPELSREDTGCNLQHISDRENVDGEVFWAAHILIIA